MNIEGDYDSIEVDDRKSFIIFLELLLQDFQMNKDNPKWENKTLESFLEAMTRYAEDIDGYYKNMNISINPDEPSWRVFADIMRGAKVYE